MSPFRFPGGSGQTVSDEHNPDDARTHDPKPLERPAKPERKIDERVAEGKGEARTITEFYGETFRIR